MPARSVIRASLIRFLPVQECAEQISLDDRYRMIISCDTQGDGAYSDCVFDLDTCKVFYDESDPYRINGPFVLLKPKKVKCSSTNPSVQCTKEYSNIIRADPCPGRIADE